MTEVVIPVGEEAEKAGDGRTFTDQMSVRGDELVKTVQALLREAAVRKITVRDKNGRTLLEFPLYAGVAGVLIIGSWSVLALVAAWFAEVSILIERDVASDEESPTVLGDAVERAATSISSKASAAGSTVGSTVTSAAGSVGSAVGGAFSTASDWARRAADSLEAQLVTPNVVVDERLGRNGQTVDVQGVEVDVATGESGTVVAAVVDTEVVPDTSQMTAEDVRREVNEAIGATDNTIQTDADDPLPPETELDSGELLAAEHKRQCAAITKAGTRCKRQAIPGSEFCSMHQPE